VRATQTLSYVSEGAIFLYVGMDTLDPLKWKVRPMLVDAQPCALSHGVFQALNMSASALVASA
jgi:hypothetical protein